MPTLRLATPADWPAIAALIGELNTRPAQQCLHCAEGRDPVLRGIEELDQRMLFVLAQTDDALVGVAGAEVDGEAAYLWGPFAADGLDQEALLDKLLDALEAALPATTSVVHTFTGQPNTRVRALLARRGYAETRQAFIYVAQPPSAPLTLVDPCPEAAPEHLEHLEALHAASFPMSTQTMRDIGADLDDDHRLFVHVEDGRAMGFLYATLSNSPVEGYVELLAVDPALRGRGVGRRLLLTALRWMFEQRQMPQVGLTVLEHRTEALGLYAATGFALAYAGVSGKLERAAVVAMA